MDYLEYLAKALGCDYLSDLHYCTVTPGQAERLLCMDAGTFSKADYERAARYLLGDGISLPTACEARSAVVTYLLKPKRGEK